MPTNTWLDTAGGHNWNQPTAWSLGRVPAANDDIVITGPHAPTRTVAPTDPLTINSLDTTALTDVQGFDPSPSLGGASVISPALTIAAGGFLNLGSAGIPDRWAGNAALAASAQFHGTSHNDGTVGDNAVFRDTSQNLGTIGDNAVFRDSSQNRGTVGATAASITKFLLNSSWQNGIVNAGKLIWNSTGLIDGIQFIFATGGAGASIHPGISM